MIMAGGIGGAAEPQPKVDRGHDKDGHPEFAQSAPSDCLARLVPRASAKSVAEANAFCNSRGQL